MEKLEKKNGMEKLMLETLMEQQREYCIWSHIARQGADGGFEQIGNGLAKTGADPLQSAAYGSWKEQDGECDV